MSHLDIAALGQFAARCRSGLESLATRSGSGSMFHGFPRGACGPASELLGRLLHEELGLTGVYVCGAGHPSLPPNQTHAWVEVGDFLIDITHDQFAGTGLAGWVHLRKNPWHTGFQDFEQQTTFCLPEHWPMYPHDGYAAMQAALRAPG